MNCASRRCFIEWLERLFRIRLRTANRISASYYGSKRGPPGPRLVHGHFWAYPGGPRSPEIAGKSVVHGRKIVVHGQIQQDHREFQYCIKRASLAAIRKLLSNSHKTTVLNSLLYYSTLF